MKKLIIGMLVILVLFSNILISKYINNTYDASEISNTKSKNINDRIISTIKTSKNIIEIDDKGRIAQVTLDGANSKDRNGEQIKLFESNQLRPLEVRFADIALNNEAFKVNVVASSSSVDATTSTQELVLTQTLANTVLTKKFKIYPDGHYDLTVTSTNDKQFYITNGFRPNVLADIHQIHGFITKTNDNILKTIEDGNIYKTEIIVGSKFVSSFDKYYTTVIYNFEKSLSTTLMPDSNSNPQAFINGGSNISFSGYIGQKNHKDLKSLNPELIDIIDYGWFTFILKPIYIFLNN